MTIKLFFVCFLSVSCCRCCHLWHPSIVVHQSERFFSPFSPIYETRTSGIEKEASRGWPTSETPSRVIHRTSHATRRTELSNIYEKFRNFRKLFLITLFADPFIFQSNSQVVVKIVYKSLFQLVVFHCTYHYDLDFLNFI